MDNGDLFRLIDVLIEHEVPLVIIGGLAVTAHGYLRTTEDSDIVFLRADGGEENLLAALSEVNAHWISNEVDPATGIERSYPVTLSYIRANSLMMLVTDLGFLDIFDFIPAYPGEDVQQLFDTAIVHDGRKFVSLEWLKKMKRATNRPKDQIDLDNLPS